MIALNHDSDSRGGQFIVRELMGTNPPASVPQRSESACISARRASCSSSRLSPILLATGEDSSARSRLRTLCLNLFGGLYVRGHGASRTLYLPCQRRMRSNAWTTLEEFDFLSNLIPQFMSQQEVRIIGPWLAATASNFFAKFPSRSAQFDRDRLTKVRNHSLVSTYPLIQST